MYTNINRELFLAEVERWDWRNASYQRGRLIASSPFGDRPDEHPSFSLVVDLDSDAFGAWNDKGAIDPAFSAGGPISLYAYMRNITYEEARDILSEITSADGAPTLRIKLRIRESAPRFREIDISPYIRAEIPYLTGRGISPAVQRVYRCGYDERRNAIVMPWSNPSGQAVNAKFRATWGKAFWYERGGAPIKSMIYGIDIAHRRNIKRALLAEAEIDAMTAASAGVFGLAVGGSEFTDEKAELLRRSPIEELLIAGDNDEAGEKLRWVVEKKMRGYLRLRSVIIPNGAKDLNAVGDLAAVREACEQATKLAAVRLRLSKI